MPDLFFLRPMEDADTNYIYETWLADLRDADASFLPNDVWYPAHREVIRRVLERATVTILADREDPGSIFGYVVRCDDYLHWIHVRRGAQWRNRGLAKKLLLETKSQDLPLVWKTPASQSKLHNPLRSRSARRSWWSVEKR